MVRVSTTGFTMQDCRVADCVKVGHNLIKTVCYNCNSMILAPTIPGKPGLYAMDCQGCGRSADAIYDEAEFDRATSREFFCDQAAYSSAQAFVERLQSERPLFATFDSLVVEVDAELTDEFVLFSRAILLGQTIKLKETCGREPSRIKELDGWLRRSCTELGFNVRRLEDK